LLEMKHREHYWVYNLCSERDYDHKKFKGRVTRFPFDDHNCPDFDSIWDFCVDVKKWLVEYDENVAVIHCKAGKGRTGLIICCWLLFNKEWDTAEDAQKFYAAARTFNQKGVTIPSQIRYIRYFEARVKAGARPPQVLWLRQIIIHNAPKNMPQEIKFSIYKGVRQVPVYEGKKKLKDVRITNANNENDNGNNDDNNNNGDGEDKGDANEEVNDGDKIVLDLPDDILLCGDWKFDMEKTYDAFLVEYIVY